MKRTASKEKKANTPDAAVQKKKTKPTPATEPPAAELRSALETVERCYKAPMPPDFLHLWQFCSELCPASPAHGLKSSLGLVLVGPFDLLRCPALGDDPDIAWDLHQRYFHDPPNLTTALLWPADRSLTHWGYVRDTPDTPPALVAKNCPEAHAGRFTVAGDNLFAAVHQFALEHDAEMAKKVGARAEALGYAVEAKPASVRERGRRSVVAPTLNGLGLVVPVDAENDIGYRPLPESDASLARILDRIVGAKEGPARLKAYEPLDEMVTLVQFANDEGDFGEGIELGLGLLACRGGSVFNSQIEQLLAQGYDFLEWGRFAEVVRAHMKKRRAGGRVSQTWGKL